MGRKHSGKWRNCSLQAISLFFHSVIKCLELHTSKNQQLTHDRSYIGAGYEYRSCTLKYKFLGYGSLVVHAQFTAILKYSSDVSKQLLAIHTALHMGHDVYLRTAPVQFYDNPTPNLSLAQSFS